MKVIDYNGDGLWSREEILARYAQHAAAIGIVPRDLSPGEHTSNGTRWIWPVMGRVIVGIEAGDRACICIGIEFIEEDAKFPFGKLLKSNTARALRRAPLTDAQRLRIKQRVLGMLRAGHVPHEFAEYAKLLKKIGFTIDELGEIPGTSKRMARFRNYLAAAAKGSSNTIGRG